MNPQAVRKRLSIKPIARTVASITALSLAGYGSVANADTAAGTILQNQATAIYQDVNTNSYTAQSNLSSITVRQIYSATIAADRSQTVAAGQTVNFSHALTNVGNGTDTYTLNIADVGSASFGSLKVFYDKNGNGQPDSGEAEIPAGATLTLERGEIASLVVQGVVPGTSIDGDAYEARLTATSANGAVTDTGTDADGTDGTNQDFAVVTGDAVLNINKSSVHDVASGQITYTITVTNSGNSPANDVALFDGLPAGTALVAGSVQGFGFGPGIDASDSAAAGVLALNEAALGADLNGDGDNLDGGDEAVLDIDLDNDGQKTGSDLPGVFAVDAVLPANTTISMSYTVEYVADDLGAGARVFNTAHASADVDGVAGADVLVTSNQTVDTVNQAFDVLADDANGFTGDAPNGDDLEAVTSAGAGTVAVFQHTLRNTGNGDDTYNLRIDNSTFPAGTTFEFWDQSGSTQLLDTNGDGLPDSGPMLQDEVKTVQVRARIPADASASNTPVTASLVATSSAAAASGQVVEDPTQLRLDAVTGPGVDLSNGVTADNDPANKDAYAGDNAAVTTLSALPGETVSFDLTVENDSAAPAAFELSVGGTWDGAQLGALPAGWSATFQNAAGESITSTVALPAGSEQVLTALVTIPDESFQALADRPASDLGLAGVVQVDGNADGDGDYAIFFRAYSAATGAEDVKLDAVDVDEKTDISLTPSSTGQIQPGGSIDYIASLRNNGNVIDTFTFNSVNSGGADGWGNSILVDTDNDGLGDTPFNALVPGSDVVWYVDANGARTSQTVGSVAGEPAIDLGANEVLPVDIRVFAPSNAANGARDLMTLTASYNGGANTVSVTDQTTVILGQLRLTKTNALDANCDGTPDGAATDSVFEISDSGAGVAPDECVVWQIVLTNEGDAAVNDVTVYDAAPAFTAYQVDSMRSCAGDAGPSVEGSCENAGSGDFNSGTAGTALSFKYADASAGANLAGHHAAVDAQGNVTFYVGSDDPLTSSSDESTTAGSGGSIPAGASVTVRFATKVE